MTLPTPTPSLPPVDDPEGVIERLLCEIRQAKELVQQIREVLFSAGQDFEKLSLVGALNALIRDNKELKKTLSSLNKELDKLIKGR